MFSHSSQFRVEWGETDTAGIIYYPNYFRWFDRNTHELFRAAGMPISRLHRQGHVHPIVESGARFWLPLLYDDQVTLATTVTELRAKTFRLEHKVSREGTPVAEGFEVRIWGRLPAPGSDERLSAVAIPEEYAALLRGDQAVQSSL